MADYAKLWMQGNLNKLAINRARSVITELGASLPCSVVGVSGSIVRVAFAVDASPWTLPQLTIPKAESPWIRMPTQVGDKGFTIPLDVYHGIISGMGSGLPKIGVTPGNLSALIFVPCSNSSSPPSDQNAAIVQGPNGAIMQTTEGTASSVITNSAGTTITFGGVTFVVNATGITGTIGAKSFALTAAGFTMDGIVFDTHVHSYLPGTGASTDTGVPI